MAKGTSLVVQWLRLCTSTTGGSGAIPGQGTKIPHATRRGQKIKLKKKSDTSHLGTSLVLQWLRICLPIQGTWVQSLVWENPTCTEQLSPCTTTTEARMPRAHALQQEKPPQ